MRFIRVLLSLVIATIAALAADARPAVAQAVPLFRGDVSPYERLMRAPPEYVVQALKVVFEELEIPLVHSTQDSTVLFAPTQLVHNRELFGRPITEYFTCLESDIAGGNLALRGRVTYAVLVHVLPTNHGVTRLWMQVDGKATRMLSTSRLHPVDCGTTGLLEKSIADAVEQLLRETAPPPE